MSEWGVSFSLESGQAELILLVSFFLHGWGIWRGGGGQS